MSSHDKLIQKKRLIKEEFHKKNLSADLSVDVA
jgi:hypothetical protein